MRVWNICTLLNHQEMGLHAPAYYDKAFNALLLLCTVEEYINLLVCVVTLNRMQKSTSVSPLLDVLIRHYVTIIGACSVLCHFSTVTLQINSQMCCQGNTIWSCQALLYFGMTSIRSIQVYLDVHSWTFLVLSWSSEILTLISAGILTQNKNKNAANPQSTAYSNPWLQIRNYYQITITDLM